MCIVGVPGAVKLSQEARGLQPQPRLHIPGVLPERVPGESIPKVFVTFLTLFSLSIALSFGVSRLWIFSVKPHW